MSLKQWPSRVALQCKEQFLHFIVYTTVEFSTYVTELSVCYCFKKASFCTLIDYTISLKVCHCDVIVEHIS